MKNFIIALCGLLVLQTSFAATDLDYIAAKVNDQIISYQAVKIRAALVAEELKANQVNLPDEKNFLHQVLESMINEELQLQMAQRANITVTDNDIQQTINDIAKQHHISTQAFIQHITENMSYSSYVAQLRDQLTLQKLQQSMIVSAIVISPAEVDSYLRSVATHENTNLYHLEDILVGVSDTPSPTDLAAAKEKAQEILMRLQTGTDFRTLAVAQSNGSQALQGGDLGWRSLPEFPDVFSKQLVNMHPGDLAGPLETPNGFHIIHLIAIKPNPKAQNKTNLREQISQMLFHQKVDQQLQIWMQQLRAQSYVETYL